MHYKNETAFYECFYVTIANFDWYNFWTGLTTSQIYDDAS